MAERTVTIASASGLHARPATIFSKAAAEQPAQVTIEKVGGSPVPAASMLMLMTLGAGNGDTVEVAGDDQAAVDQIAALVEKDLDATD